jgi:hypothetical protein
MELTPRRLTKKNSCHISSSFLQICSQNRSFSLPLAITASAPSISSVSLGLGSLNRWALGKMEG